ncbi:MAG: T9SS type A sorting domain-containing protein [Flavobacteriales bacterium]
MKRPVTLLLACAALTMQAQTTHEIQVVDDEFLPPTLTIELGDAIHLNFIDAQHTFTQVTQATWMANDDTPMPGGFAYGVGTSNPGTDFTFTPTTLGTSYYICEFHVDMGMKGTFTVVDATGIGETAGTTRYSLGPNPANDQLSVLQKGAPPLVISFFDATGKLYRSATMSGGIPLSIADLPNGIYFLELRDTDMLLLGTQRLVVTR